MQPANPRSAKVDALGVAFVATGSRDKAIKIWDALTGQCLWTFVSIDTSRLIYSSPLSGWP